MPKNRLCNLAAIAVLVWAVVSPAQTFTVVTRFDWTNGAYPNAPLVQGLDGNLYGTAAEGGTNGEGTIFKITAAGKLTTLYNFCSQANCADGNSPAGLVLAIDGSFYGTTYIGGANNWGTVFKITPSGVLTTLHSFCLKSGCTDGGIPMEVLTQGADGSFYGTTRSGGDEDDGTVFNIAADGTFKVLHSFNKADGANPWAGLVQGTDGNFYGTTLYGGIGDGTVFEVTPNGKLTTLYLFDDIGGSFPSGGLIQATDGDFYGTAAVFGGRLGGTFFRVTAVGDFTKLYAFCGRPRCNTGYSPHMPVIQATDRNFYGTTDIGSEAGDEGTIFRITPKGAFRKLHTFYQPDGDVVYPQALSQATGGTLYGSTAFGGKSNPKCTNSVGCGRIYSLDVGLGPFVEAVPYSGKVGARIKILGQKLTGTTGVSFNGTAASFIIKSDTCLTAIVPAGATTGFVTVNTLGGLLTSNKQFRVQP